MINPLDGAYIPTALVVVFIIATVFIAAFIISLLFWIRFRNRIHHGK